jgi:hypothetical protein
MSISKTMFLRSLIGFLFVKRIPVSKATQTIGTKPLNKTDSIAVERKIIPLHNSNQLPITTIIDNSCAVRG